MGAYLSEPIVEKLSSDELNEYLQVGSSSMQGWRISQEDAHNCILKYDENTSLFAVYDGHGGAEVATYSADKLPDFIKQLKSYKDKDFEKALKEAFIKFDSTLLDEKVVDVLKRLAGDRNPEHDSDMMDDDEEEDLDELCQEGTLPLEKVLAKYKAKGPQQQPIGKAICNMPLINKLKKDDLAASTSKPLSPCLRGRRNIHINKNIDSVLTDGPTTTSNITEISDKNSIEKTSVDDGIVSSSASVSKSPNKIDSTNDNKSNEADASNEIIENNKSEESIKKSKEISNSPDSSAETTTTDNIQNGNIKTSEQSGVSSSSSSSNSTTSGVSSISPVKEKLENGEITSPSSSVLIKSSSNQIPGKSPMKILRKSPIKSRAVTGALSSGISSSIDTAGDDSTSDSDVDFQAEDDEDDSETDDGEEDCEPIADVEDTDDDDEEEVEDEDDDDDDEMDEDAYKDEQFCANMIEEPGKDSGCTAVVAILHGRDLYVANAGDSRCVVCRDGKAIDMSIDHKPEDEEESTRIAKAGGRVTLDGRVNGGLNLSRAIGDHAYKANPELKPEEQMISALPDIKKLILDPKDEFMILACDGIWNYMSSEEVVDFVKERIDDGFDKMSKICEELFEMCLAPNTLGDGTGCDNMTAVIIRFKPQILKLSTKINPNETITMEQQKPSKINLDSKATPTSNEQQPPITADNSDGGGDDNKQQRKCIKRSASPISIENSCSSNSNNTTTTDATTTTSTSNNNLDITEPCQKRLKTDDSIDSVASSVGISGGVDGAVEKIECSSSNNSNSCSSNGTAEAEAAAASITITNDIGSTTTTDT